MSTLALPPVGVLSRSARLCEQIIRLSRARRGGVRECGRSYLARRLGCSNRQVSRYVAELREAGRLHVTPPRRVRTSRGWRTTGVNRYRLTAPAHPAPHIRRSTRGDTGVTPPLAGSGMRVPRPTHPAISPPPGPPPGPPPPAERRAAYLATMRAALSEARGVPGR